MLPSTKQPLIQNLALAFERHGFKVPYDAIDELRAFEVLTMASGYNRFTAPSGMHDDWVIMLAILWYAMTGGGASTSQNISDLGEADEDYQSRWDFEQDNGL
jgi:hypothetical protein